MKKLIYAVMLLLGLSMIASCGNGQDKTNENTEPQVQQETVPVEEEAGQVDNHPRVYACAYDAFVNIREEPKSKSSILGVFKNGPEGAVLLGVEGEWTKIDCDGIVGYVLSKYVKDTPTVAYTGTATIDDIGGVYWGAYGMILWYDGTWERGYDWACEYGHYILQNNEVKLIPDSHCVDADPTEWEDYNAAKAEANSEILPIDLAHHKIGEYQKQPFITKKDIEEAKEEYGEDWKINLYGDYPQLMTKEDFKKKGH